MSLIDVLICVHYNVTCRLVSIAVITFTFLLDLLTFFSFVPSFPPEASLMLGFLTAGNRLGHPRISV